jgi:hypothetical protein
MILQNFDFRNAPILRDCTLRYTTRQQLANCYRETNDIGSYLDALYATTTNFRTVFGQGHAIFGLCNQSNKAGEVSEVRQWIDFLNSGIPPSAGNVLMFHSLSSAALSAMMEKLGIAGVNGKQLVCAPPREVVEQVAASGGLFRAAVMFILFANGCGVVDAQTARDIARNGYINFLFKDSKNNYADLAYYLTTVVEHNIQPGSYVVSVIKFSLFLEANDTQTQARIMHDVNRDCRLVQHLPTVGEAALFEFCMFLLVRTPTLLDAARNPNPLLHGLDMFVFLEGFRRVLQLLHIIP